MAEAKLAEKLPEAAERLVDYAETRLELLQCEWAIERLRLSSLVASNIEMLFFSFLSVVMVLLLIVAWFWDTPHRLTAIGVTVAASVIAAVVAGARYRAKRSEPSALFRHSVQEFMRDRQALEQLR